MSFTSLCLWSNFNKPKCFSYTFDYNMCVSTGLCITVYGNVTMWPTLEYQDE